MTKRSMSARLARLEDVLRKRVSGSSGGWPHWLHIDKASTSIVGTAHALAMLRMRGREFDEKLVDDGLRYLAREVREQTKPGARGTYARYPSYALWGLSRFPAALSDPEIFAGAKFSATWLLGRTRPSGGWTVDGTRDDQAEISLPATMAAVHGLDRTAPYVRGVFGDKCLTASARARDAIAAAAEPSSRGSFWRQRQNSTPCPGATSLAVLTLAGGSPGHREVAKQGIAYLRSHRKDWTTSVHVDDQLEQLTWRIMSFSLGLRALLHPCATKPPVKPIVQEVVSHFDALWDERTGAWAVQQGHDASTTGSYAVFAAVRALKNAWAFDPVAAYALSRPEAVAKGSSAEPAAGHAAANGAQSQRRVRMVDGKQGIYISDPAISDREFYVAWDGKASSQWGILEALLLLKQSANRRKHPSQYHYTLSLEELAAHTKTRGIDAATIERTIRRVNERISAAATEARIHSFPGLIEKIVPGDSDEVRYGIEETEVIRPAP